MLFSTSFGSGRSTAANRISQSSAAANASRSCTQARLASTRKDDAVALRLSCSATKSTLKRPMSLDDAYSSLSKLCSSTRSASRSRRSVAPTRARVSAIIVPTLPTPTTPIRRLAKTAWRSEPHVSSVRRRRVECKTGRLRDGFTLISIELPHHSYLVAERAVVFSTVPTPKPRAPNPVRTDGKT